MDQYPADQTQQLAPLVGVSLGEGGYVNVVKTQLERFNIAHRVWDNSILKNRIPTAKYILRFDNESKIFEDVQRHKKKSAKAHSVLSPFNPESDLFPNGIISNAWFKKYTYELPCTLIAFHNIGKTADQDDVLARLLLDSRLKFAEHGIRYVAIIVSSTPDPDEDNLRIALLRQVSGLAKLSGLFYLNVAAQTLNRDADILVSTVLNTVKNSAMDFYSAIDFLVRQRYKKYYSIPNSNVDTEIALDPKFLETRNFVKLAILAEVMHPHNAEPSLEILENAHESLVSILLDHSAEFVLRSVSPHDANLYRQFRVTLDVIAFHLCRGYFSIEEPVVALRKVEAHIANVTSLAPSRSHGNWISLQYQWLAELMEKLLPGVLEKINLPKDLKKGANTSVFYYGGISFHDSLECKVTTQIPLLYLKAALLLSSEAPSPISYPKLQNVTEKRIQLLETARAANKARGNLKSIESYIAWQIAETYLESGDTKLSVEQLKALISAEGVWKSVANSSRLKIAALDADSSLTHIVRLALDGSESEIPGGNHEISLSESVDCVDLDISMFNENLSQDTFAYDTVVIQIQINVKQPQLARMNSTLKLKSLDVEFLDRTLLIKILDSDQAIQKVDVTDKTEVTCALSENGILQLSQLLSVSGTVAVKSVTSHFQFIVTSGQNQIDASLQNTQSPKNTAKFLTVYHEENKAVVGKKLRLWGRPASQIEVKSYRPDIGVKMSMPSSSIIVGEEVQLPLRLHFNRPSLPHLNFKEVLLESRTQVRVQGEIVENLLIQASWEGMKDDEPVSILDFVNSTDTKTIRTLRLSVRKPPTSQSIGNLELTIHLNIAISVHEAAGTVSLYELEAYELPLLDNAYETTISMVPASDDGSLHMPNPFVLNADGATAEDVSIPLPVRYWNAKVLVIDKYGILASGAIEVEPGDIFVKSTNPDIEIKYLEPFKSEGYFAQPFITKCRHRLTHRNVIVQTSAQTHWTRKGSDKTAMQATDEKELSLALQDPRVLFQPEVSGNVALLKYTIENPTPRILTFTYELRANELGNSSWLFEEKDNLIPFRLNAFSVLPFSHFAINFTGTFADDPAVNFVELPQLQVYDVNYRVTLPPLPINENAIFQGGKLVLKTRLARTEEEIGN